MVEARIVFGAAYNMTVEWMTIWEGRQPCCSVEACLVETGRFKNRLKSKENLSAISVSEFSRIFEQLVVLVQ